MSEWQERERYWDVFVDTPDTIEPKRRFFYRVEATDYARAARGRCGDGAWAYVTVKECGQTVSGWQWDGRAWTEWTVQKSRRPDAPEYCGSFLDGPMIQVKSGREA